MWIARCKADGQLYGFSEKPARFSALGRWESKTEKPTDEILAALFIENIFPDLKWEDEPIEVEIKKI